MFYGIIVEQIKGQLKRFQPDIILCIGAYHVPSIVLRAVAALNGRPPIMGWVGDMFRDDIQDLAKLYDVVAYTDSALVQRHKDMHLTPSPLFLPHAVDPRMRKAVDRRKRRVRMVFVATPTPERESIVRNLVAPISLFGPNWRPSPTVNHELHPRRLAKSALPMIYGSHLAALNIRNEKNVLAGLNQRSFEPALAGAALVVDNQTDLPRCFDPGREVYAWNDIDELNDAYARILRDPDEAVKVGERGLKRVLAEHTYSDRLKQLAALL